MDVNARLTATQAMKHTWMTSNDINDIDILDTVRENFNPRRTLKSAVSAVQAMNRLKVAAAVPPTHGEKKSAAMAFSKALGNAKLRSHQHKEHHAAPDLVPVTAAPAPAPADKPAVAVAAL